MTKHCEIHFCNSSWHPRNYHHRPKCQNKQSSILPLWLNFQVKSQRRSNFVSIFWATVCKTVCPMLSDRCLSVCRSCLSVCNVGVLWTNGLTDQDETSHAGRPWPWPHCVTWGPSSPSPKGEKPPIFGQYPLRPNGCIDQDSTWYGGRPRPGATLC